jgi:signal transduction histidine kinase
LQDPALAVLELIKNAWDADARRVTVAITTKGKSSKIIVSDDGHGMSDAEFRNRWLVIGASYKRVQRLSENGRPLIGEKGLGRLATVALGRAVRIESAREPASGFSTDINWRDLKSAESLEDYPIVVQPKRRKRGTLVEISKLEKPWEPAHTKFLISHAEFLASVPGEDFAISFSVDSKKQRLAHPAEQIARFSEASIKVKVNDQGQPIVESCSVGLIDKSDSAWRPLKDQEVDQRLAGMRIELQFFRRDEALKQRALEGNLVRGILERYQGVRVFRDGINVPPYGLNGDDWASLEKQRTRYGGPTMVPGNSQLMGELHLDRLRHGHLTITAGRAGFADQQAVSSLAAYLRWTVIQLGTARRAAKLGIGGGKAVPPRVDRDRQDGAPSPARLVKEAFKPVNENPVLKRDPDLRRQVESAANELLMTLRSNEETLRLYAQLASTGIAATSFAHELRAEFDVMSESIKELQQATRRPDRELVDLMGHSWGRVRSFGALFQVVPVKLRRQLRQMAPAEIRKSALTALALATADKVGTHVALPKSPAHVVPAELDSIFVNLVSNAVKAINESDNRGTGRILITFETKGRDLELGVADNGCGVSDKMRAVMFEPLEGSFAEGTGMGLPIVQFLASRYDGFARLSESPPSGYSTLFLVVLKNVTGR